MEQVLQQMIEIFIKALFLKSTNANSSWEKIKNKKFRLFLNETLFPRAFPSLIPGDEQQKSPAWLLLLKWEKTDQKSAAVFIRLFCTPCLKSNLRFQTEVIFLSSEIWMHCIVNKTWIIYFISKIVGLFITATPLGFNMAPAQWNCTENVKNG